MLAALCGSEFIVCINNATLTVLETKRRNCEEVFHSICQEAEKDVKSLGINILLPRISKHQANRKSITLIL